MPLYGLPVLYESMPYVPAVLRRRGSSRNVAPSMPVLRQLSHCQRELCGIAAADDELMGSTVSCDRCGDAVSCGRV